MGADPTPSRQERLFEIGRSNPEIRNAIRILLNAARAAKERNRQKALAALDEGVNDEI